jgi:hypothetical protein
MANSNQYKDTHIKYIKRTVPALIHIPDQSTSAWKRPCLVRHRLHPYLSYTLDSPLVSIYHQIEVTFQFGMKYEEIKARIPIIVASIPKRESTTSSAAAQASLVSAAATDELMMKYAFEEVARSEFLSYRLESRSSTDCTTDDDLALLSDDTYNVLRDTSAMPPTSDDDGEGQITGRVTPMMFVTKGRLPSQPVTYYKSLDDLGTGGKRAFSPPHPPPQENIFHLGVPSQGEHRQIKKFASAFDLSTASQESCSINDEYHEPLEERPRTTTPTMKRQPIHQQRKVLSPINVDLANSKQRGPLPPPHIDLPPIPTQQQQQQQKSSLINTLSESESSDVLPAIDRLTLNKSNTTQNISSRKHNNNKAWQEDDDLRSVYSDISLNSATNAPSLSSSATLSTNKSYPTLHSRPPSPVFSPAPGLPATIALRPHQQQENNLEEMFPPPPESASSVSSPAMNTVASSTLLSPRTRYALRQRIALSTISSLTNDSIPTRARSISSSLDPDVQSLLMMSEYTNSSLDSSAYYPPLPPNRYVNARLPPIPDYVIPLPRERSSKRLTKIYIDDSDDEKEDEEEEVIPSLPKLPTQQQQGSISSSNNHSSNTSTEAVIINGLDQDDCAPPKLPRLSFGGDFGISLGI